MSQQPKKTLGDIRKTALTGPKSPGYNKPDQFDTLIGMSVNIAKRLDNIEMVLGRLVRNQTAPSAPMVHPVPPIEPTLAVYRARDLEPNKYN